jgi:hypothetical protein
MPQSPAAIAAATFVAAGSLTVSAPDAQAAPGDCTDWAFGSGNAVNVSGDFVPPDPDGFTITFSASGKNPSGPAQASSLPLIGTADGNIAGNVNGNKVFLVWKQSGGKVVVPLDNGTIGPDGNAHGTTGGDFAGGTWTTTNPLLCNNKEDAPAAAPAGPPPGPTLTPKDVPGGLVVTVTDKSGKTSKCHYDSEVFKRDFTLPANSSTDLTFIPALALDRDWPVTVTCDNGATTQQTIHF